MLHYLRKGCAQKWSHPICPIALGGFMYPGSAMLASEHLHKGDDMVATVHISKGGRCIAAVPGRCFWQVCLGRRAEITAAAGSVEAL